MTTGPGRPTPGLPNRAEPTRRVQRSGDQPPYGVRGPVVDRPPPRETIASRPVAFASRDRTSGPQWASGAKMEAADLGPTNGALVRPRDLVEVSLPGERWEELTSANEAFGLLVGARVVWTVPLSVQRTPLEDIASGRHDREWRELGELVARGGSPVVRIVLPEGGEPTRSAAAFRRAAAAVRQTPGVAVEWGVPTATPPAVWAAAWPGDDVVDIVGIPLAAGASWTAQVAAPGGLADWSTWARSRHRRLGVHWELDADVDADRVARVADWLDVAARTSVLAYDSVATTGETRSDALTTYRELH